MVDASAPLTVLPCPDFGVISIDAIARNFLSIEGRTLPVLRATAGLYKSGEYRRPECGRGRGAGAPKSCSCTNVQAGRTENRNLAETPVLDGISTHENPAKAQLHIM